MININIQIEADTKDDLIDKLYELIDELEFTDNKAESSELRNGGVFYDLYVD
jgi:hypothetical protein